MARERGMTKQVQDVLDSKLKIGFSKHQDKKAGVTADHIYSWGTYRTYLKHGCYFAKWAKTARGVKKLEDARKFIDEYIEMRIEQGVSAYTQKLEASAIAKIYGCSTREFIKTKNRTRVEITRSRGTKERDRHFSEKNHQEFVDFCKATGLRRSELKSLTKEQLFFNQDTNTYYLRIVGKGGRVRNAPVLDEGAVDKIKSENGVIWKKIPNGADIHFYRSVYCTKLYEMNARERLSIPEEDRYCCRKDLKGTWYDKPAMLIASKALGHNRISVIAGHYLKTTGENE